MATSGSVSTSTVTGGKLTFSWNRTNSGLKATINWTMTLTGTRDGTTTSNYHTVTVSATSGTASTSSLSVSSMTVNVVNGVTATTSKSGSFTLTRNNNGNGGFKISFSTYINGNSVSASQSWTLDSVTVYSKCGAPTSITASPANVTTNGTITISWSGATNGTNNSISSYQVYWYVTSGGTAPSTSTYTGTKNISSTSTSGSTTITLSSATIGHKVVFGVVTRGSAGSSYYSAIKTGGNVTVINTVPGSPTVTVNKSVLPSSGGSVKFTITPGSDENSSQTLSVRYRTDSTTPTTSNTTAITSGTSLSVSATTTYYFYTYDGTAFSGAKTVSVRVNAVPGAPSVTEATRTVKPGVALTWTVTAGSVQSGETATLYYATTSGGTKTKFTSPLNLTASSTRGNSTTYYFYTYDGYDYSSATTRTITINSFPAVPTVTVSSSIIKSTESSKTITYTIKTTSTDNSRVYYTTTNTTTPTTSWSYVAASGATTVTKDISLTGTATYYFWSYDSLGEFSSSKATVTVTKNAKPGKPTVSPTSKIVIPGNAVNISATAGADSNSGQTLTVYYATSSTGTKTKMTTSSISVTSGSTAGNSVSRWFWTYDGYEYSDSATATIISNTRPSPPTVSVSPTIVAPGGKVSFTVTAGTDVDTSQTRTLSYSADAAGTTKTSFTSPYQVTTATTAGHGTTSTIWFWTYDGLQYSSSGTSKSYKINNLPPAPTRSTSAVIISSTATSCHPTVTAGTDSTDGQTLTVYYGTSAAAATTKYTSTVNLAPSGAGAVATYYFRNHDGLEYGTSSTSVTIKRNIPPSITNLTVSGNITTIGSVKYLPAAGTPLTFTITATSNSWANITAYYYRWDYIANATSTNNRVINVTSPSYTTSGLPASKQIIFRTTAYDEYDYSSVSTLGPYTINSAPNKPSWVSNSEFIVANTGTTVTFDLTPGNANSGASALAVYYATSPSGTKTLATNNKLTTSTLNTYYFWTYDGVDYSTQYVTGTLSTAGEWGIKSWGSSGSTYDVSTYTALGTSTSSGNFLGWADTVNFTLKNSSAVVACNAEIKAQLINKDGGASLGEAINLGNLSIAKNGSVTTTYNVSKDMISKISSSLDTTSIGWKLIITPYYIDSTNTRVNRSSMYLPSDSTKYYAIPKAPSITVSSGIHNKNNTENYTNGNYSTLDNSYLYFGKKLYIVFPFDAKATNAIISYTIDNNTNIYNVSNQTVTPISGTTNGLLVLDFENISSFSALQTQDHKVHLTIKLQDTSSYAAYSTKQISVTEDKVLSWVKTPSTIVNWNIRYLNNHNPYYNSITNYPNMEFSYTNLVSDDFSGATWDLIKTDLLSKRFINDFKILVYKDNSLNSSNASSAPSQSSDGKILFRLIGGDTQGAPTIDSTNHLIKIIDDSSTHLLLDNIFDYTQYGSSNFMGMTTSNTTNNSSFTAYIYGIYGDIFGRWAIRSSQMKYIIKDTYNLTLVVKYKKQNGEQYSGTYDSNTYLQGGQPVQVTGKLSHKAAINKNDLVFNFSKKIGTNVTNIKDGIIFEYNISGNSSNNFISTDLPNDDTIDTVNFTKEDIITYTIKTTNLPSSGSFSGLIDCNVRPQYAPESFQINSITILKDESVPSKYSLRLNYNCKYNNFPEGGAFDTSDLTVVRFTDSTETGAPVEDCLSGTELPKEVINQEKEGQLISSFGEEGATYDVKNPNFLALKIEMGTTGSYSDNVYSYKTFYTPIRIAILQTPSLALRKNRVGINVNDNNLFELGTDPTNDPKHFFVAQQFEQNSSIAYINSTKDQITLFNPSTQVLKVKVLQANSTNNWTEERYFDFLHGIFK